MDKSRLVYQLDTPFSSVQWPEIPQQDQDSILELLCSVLSPVGQHRKSYLHPSKGRRSKARQQKRKRDQESEAQPQLLVPPAPAVAALVDVGLTSITRHLEASCAATQTGSVENSDEILESPYSVIFIARSGPSPTFYSHFPHMVAVASRRLKEPIRLVAFSKSCEEKLSACLGIPRVSSVALRAGDSGACKGLVDFVRQKVPVVEAPWLEDAGKGEFRETKINAIQALVGTKRQKKKG